MPSIRLLLHIWRGALRRQNAVVRFAIGDDDDDKDDVIKCLPTSQARTLKEGDKAEVGYRSPEVGGKKSRSTRASFKRMLFRLRRSASSRSKFDP